MSRHISQYVSMTITKNAEDECWQGCGEMGTLACCWWECKTLWKTVYGALKKLNMELPCDTAILHLDIYPKESRSGS